MDAGESVQPARLGAAELWLRQDARDRVVVGVDNDATYCTFEVVAPRTKRCNTGEALLKVDGHVLFCGGHFLRQKGDGSPAGTLKLPQDGTDAD
jgi:hypothetical protein